MPLRLGSLGREIEEMASREVTLERRQRVERAREALRTLDPREVRARLEDPRTVLSWPAALPLGALAAAFPAPEAPRDFSVAAADGSSMGPDRHFPVRYYVLNTGYAVITYGSRPGALLDSRSRLYFRDEEVYLALQHRTLPVEGAILSAKMVVEELATLLEVASQAPRPVVALTDGVIILWGLQNVPEEVQGEFLGPFLETLDRFAQERIPVANYISLPGAHDVVNALRVGLCPEPVVNCVRCEFEAGREESACGSLAGIPDRELFTYLREGERSDLFQSRAPILEKYREHRVGCFYVNAGQEIARVEAPLWVLENPAMLDLVHAAVADQCRRGRGYPPALQEAHEQAAITTADRRVVEEMIEEAFARRRVVLPWSAKERSKRERGI
ncbi:MAG: DNA double-strand break repair nuclease NurA [Anaerolineae bacterium]